MTMRSAARARGCPLSPWERAGVRAVPSRLRVQAPLTLTLSRRERGEHTSPCERREREYTRPQSAMRIAIARLILVRTERARECAATSGMMVSRAQI
jgi:hypothetical protein